MSKIDLLTRKVEELSLKAAGSSAFDHGDGISEKVDQKTTNKKGQKNRKNRPGGAATSTSTNTGTPGSDHRTTSETSVAVDSSSSSPESTIVSQLGNSKNASNPAQSDLLSNFEEDNKDSGVWELVCERKPVGRKCVMFVGNLPCSAVPEKIAEFVTVRASEAKVNVKIYECKIFKKERSSSARLVLDAKSARLVNSREFWPRPLYSRLWNFDKYDSTSPQSRSPAGDDEAMDLLSGLPNIRTETRPADESSGAIKGSSINSE